MKVAGGPVVGSLVSGNINPRQVVTHDKTIIRTFKNNFALKLESSSSFLTLPTLKSYTYIHVTFACIWPRLWPKTNDPTIGPFPSKNAEPFLRKNLHLGMVSTPTLDGRIPSSDGEQ